MDNLQVPPVSGTSATAMCEELVDLLPEINNRKKKLHSWRNPPPYELARRLEQEIGFLETAVEDLLYRACVQYDYDKRAIIELENGWDIVQNGITIWKKITEEQEGSFSSEDYMTLHQTIFAMCTQKPQQLYEKSKETFEEYIKSTVLHALREKHDESMLRELVKRWENYHLFVRWISRFFLYLDEYFLARRLLPSLSEVSVKCFRDLVYQELNGKARDAVIVLIDQERDGEQIDRALLKNVLDIFVGIGMGQMEYYENDFEDAMLKDTATYYSRKASSWILECSCPDYILKTEECLEKERDRVSHYLHFSEEKLLETVQNELLVVYTNKLLEKEYSGCRALLRDDKVEDLSRMSRLFHRIPMGLEHVAHLFKQHVTSAGEILVQQAEDLASNKVFVRQLIELHDKSMTYVTECFNNNFFLHMALKEAFEVLCNKTVSGCSSAELLASYCDDVLKRSWGEKLSDVVVEEMLDKVVNLLAYISDIDLFAEFCRRNLARRLNVDRSSIDHEMLILKKLNQQFGGELILKMERMVTDLTLARRNEEHFRRYLRDNPAVKPGIRLSVTVLPTGAWPGYKYSDLRLPEELANCVEVFTEFYQKRVEHRRRKLTWIYSLGTCNVNGQFASKTIELIVGTYQAAVLLLFNASDRLSYSEIKSQLNLPDDDLIGILQSLSCAEYKILTKEPSNKIVSSSDHFEFNSKFTDMRRSIRVPLPPVDDLAVTDERKKSIDTVYDNRGYVIDACIVRIMKREKVLPHQQLVLECVEQLSRTFKPDLKAIKERIEKLIEQEYLERDAEVLKYIS